MRNWFIFSLILQSVSLESRGAEKQVDVLGAGVIPGAGVALDLLRCELHIAFSWQCEISFYANSFCRGGLETRGAEWEVLVDGAGVVVGACVALDLILRCELHFAFS